MYRKNPGIKIPYLRIDLPVPTTTRCVEVRIPNDPDFMPVLGGLVKLATQWFNYERDASHTGRSLAAIWQKAYIETDWMQCMNCEEMRECLQPLFDALQLAQRYGDNSGVKPGEVPPPEQNETNVAGETNPTCDKDILWAQSTQLVSWMNQLVVDVLEIAESATNDVELLQVLGELPVINEFGAASAAAYIDLILEGINENYTAQFTLEYAEEYACAIMQKCCNDCIITPDRLYDVAWERVQTHFVDLPTSFATIFDLWAYLSDQDIDGTIIADVMFLMGFGGGALANAFFSAVGIKPIQIILALAVNDANDDWLILCPDCPLPEAENIGIFTLCGTTQSTVEFEDGVPFDVIAYEITESGVTSYNINLRLPPGNWNVALNSITGTITPPVDETETAYAWHDTAGVFHNVTWNGPGEPDEFGNKDTTAAIFSAWCDTVPWNATLFNAAPFTANFTVTAL